MPNLKIETNGYYTADDLYQWDLNQTLTIYGVSVKHPILHFNSKSMVFSVVRHPTVDNSGVISCEIPNSLLQKAEPITVYVCQYDGEIFKTYYTLELKVKGRPKPADYTLEVDDGEVYSFTELMRRIGVLEDDHSTFENQVIGRVSTAEFNVRTTLSEAKIILDDISQFKTDIIGAVRPLIDEVADLKTHVKPWDIDENVGPICTGFYSVSLESRAYNYSYEDQTGVKSSTVAIPMINSGTINLKMHYNLSASDPTREKGENNYVRVYVNDELRYEIAHDSKTSYIEDDATIPLTVNRGDTLTITASVLCEARSSSEYVKLNLTDVGIHANIDTVHKYIDFTSDLGEPTTADILNTLLGV